MYTRKLSYVLITSARNEEKFIAKTIDSVISQTVKPKKWIIVSDGSTDHTDDIVKSYRMHHFITLIRMPEHPDRHFAAKVNCFNEAYGRLKDQNFEIIGNLDADVSFESDYFEFILSKFEQMPQLGVAGTPYIEKNKSSYSESFTDPDHVSGQCQIFRRSCFDQIGGYIPIKGGGIDWTAVTTARMKGWTTRSFSDKHFIHHRSMGTASNGILMSRFKHGQKDYYLGGDPLWQIFRSVYQMTKKPYILGGLSLLAGFTYAGIRKIENPIPRQLINFHRTEQRKRLRESIRKFTHI